MNTDPFDQLKRLGEDVARSVPEARSEAAVARALAAATTLRQRRRIPAIAVATLGLFVVANFGVASVANASVPGDALYPVDRAYEWASDAVGLGADRTEERLGEATVLVERSEYERALDLVSESVDDGTLASAAAALKVADLGGDDLSARVLALVDGAHQISAAARSGDSEALADAQSEMRQLAADVADVAGTQGNSGQSGDTPAATAPGQTGNSGPSGDTPAATAPGQTDNPGQGNPGQSNPGQGNPGQGNPPDDSPGQGNPGQGNPPDDSPGQGNPGQGNPPDDNPGQGNPGQGNSGQGNSGN